MKSVHWLLCLVASLGIAPAGPARAALAFHVDVDTHGELPSGGSGTALPDTHRALDATLSAPSMTIRSDDETVIYDFVTRKRTVIDRAGQRVEYSLYDGVGMRVLELENRVRLGKVLAAAKLDHPTMGTIDNEHALGIQDQPSSPLQVHDDAQGRTFSDGSHVFYQQGPEGTEVTPEQAHWFARFLRHSGLMHPQIVASVDRSTIIASAFVVTTDQPFRTTTTYHVRDVRTVPDVVLDSTSHPARPVAATSDPLDRALDRAALLTPGDLARARQKNGDALAAARRDGRPLDILLGTAERNLMTGETVARFTPEELQLLQTDAVTAQVRGALTAGTREQLAAAVKVFVDARASTTTNLHVLALFEANDRAKLGDRKAALALFTEVFAANPTIASAYKDFGDVLLMGYDTPRAWRSWDAGRRIAPGIANFAAVDQFERSLAARHPEFF